MSIQKEKISSILMFISFVMYSAVFVMLIILTKMQENAVLILLGFVTAILFLISAITINKNKLNN